MKIDTFCQYIGSDNQVISTAIALIVGIEILLDDLSQTITIGSRNH